MVDLTMEVGQVPNSFIAKPHLHCCSDHCEDSNFEHGFLKIPFIATHRALPGLMGGFAAECVDETSCSDNWDPSAM